MKTAGVLVLIALVPLINGINLQEDDLVFDDVGEDTSQSPTIINAKDHETNSESDETKNANNNNNNNANNKHESIEKFWGVSDAVATVGHMFKLKIPKQAFSGSVDHYEVRFNGDKTNWLYFDEAASTLMGVPSKKDVGVHNINLKAYGTSGDIANDVFNVKVMPEKFDHVKHKDEKSHCDDSEEQTLMTILLDAKFDDLKPITKVEAIEYLARFLGLHNSAFSMHGRGNKEESAVEDSRVILTGPGNVQRRKEKHSTCIQWQVGCDGHLWRHQADLLNQIKQQALDGTLNEVLQLPVLLWRVKTEPSDSSRYRRETGSGDYGINGNNDEDYDEDYDYDSDYYDGDGDDNEPPTELPPNSIVPSATLPRGSKSGQDHPHRHHHGEETVGSKVEENIDEDEIVPVIDNKLDRTFNASTMSSIPRLTTIQQTSTTSTTTTTTTSTTITPIPSTTTTTTAERPMSTLTTTNEIETSPAVVVSSTTPSILLTTTISTTPLINTITPTNIDTILTLANGTKFDNITTTTTTTTITTTSTEMTNNNRTTTDADTDSLLPNVPITDNETETPPPIIVTTLPSTMSSTMSNKELNVVVTATSNDTIDETIDESEMLTTIAIPITPVMTTTTQQVSVAETSPSTMSSTHIATAVPDVNLDTTSTTTTTTTTTMSTTTLASTTTATTQQPTTTITTAIPRRVTIYPVVQSVPNHSPTRLSQLQKIPVTAGKPLSYVIPANTFNDIEDGDTRNLTLDILFERNHLNTTHWLQFNSKTQEVYGLPLEEDVSVWDYEVVATDRNGKNVSDNLKIYVQQHKLSRTITHEFSLNLRIEKRSVFPKNVDWELKIIRDLAQLYGDKDASDITVRSIDVNGVHANFTWTNDSIPRGNECPKDEINKLLHVLIANRDGEPSAMLREVLAPEIRVQHVVFRGLGQCETMNHPDERKLPTQEPKPNFPPVPRNQVDHINATIGQLLVLRVPEDTFYDPEDGSARNMRLSLLTIDREPIPPNDWLQFDVKNQEFYGVPMKNDQKRKEYQLVATDKDGASATDGLVVVVHPLTDTKSSAEFTIKLGTDFDTFSQSAMLKKNFIDRLRDLFGDKDTNAIQLTSILPSGKNTIITWRNTTLPTTYCPNDEITHLSDVLFVKPDNKGLTNRIERIMGSDFPVDQLTLTPMGICQGEFTRVHSNDNGITTPDDSRTLGGASNDDYLITFVLPAIIISAMLILAGIIACVLYRRKRSGKMSVSEHDDERQSFRSKGIPVIFQDELEEKPDPGNKSPVILKEEKPPLPPPEYQKGAEDGADQPMLPKENSEEPYQPPPPFARTSDNNRQNRPKPTPTYRKPPPYVPP